MSSKFYIQTRGKTIDYCFLFQAPEVKCWLSYKDCTSFEDPTLIIEMGRFYLSGIPSERRDRVETIIRFTFVAEFDEMEQGLLALTKVALDELFKPSGDQRTLSRLFDEYFPEEYVENALRSCNIDNNSEEMKELEKKFEQLLSKAKTLTKEMGSGSSQIAEGIWWGGLENHESRLAWEKQAEKILAGASGKALLLNLLDSDKSLQELDFIHKESNVALLLPDRDDEWQKLERKIPYPAPKSPFRNWHLPRRFAPVLLIALILIFPIKIMVFNSHPSIELFEVSSLKDVSEEMQGSGITEGLSIAALISYREEIQSIQLTAQLLNSNQDLLNESLPLNRCKSQGEKTLECLFPVSIPKNRIEPGVYTFKLAVQDKEGRMGSSSQEYSFVTTSE